MQRRRGGGSVRRVDEKLEVSPAWRLRVLLCAWVACWEKGGREGHGGRSGSMPGLCCKHDVLRPPPVGVAAWCSAGAVEEAVQAVQWV